MGLFGGGPDYEKMRREGDVDGLIAHLKNEKSPEQVKVISGKLISLGNKAVPALLELSTSDDDEEFGKAASIIMTMGSEIVPRLAEAVNEEKDWEYRASAARALAQLADGRALEPLRRSSRGSARQDPRLLNQIAIALKVLGDDTGLLAMIEEMETNQTPLSVNMLGVALEEITGEELGNDPGAWRRWWDSRSGSEVPTEAQLTAPEKPEQGENMNTGLDTVAAYLGKAFNFEITPQGPNQIRADDPTKKFMAFTIIEEDRLLKFHSCYVTGPLVSQHPEAYTMFLCDLNKNSRVTKYYMDNELDLMMKAVLTNPITPEGFAVFMTNWEMDLRALHRGETGDLLGKFLSGG